VHEQIGMRVKIPTLQRAVGLLSLDTDHM